MVPKTTNKILTIDDDEVTRKIIVDYLDDGGYEVLEASNGKEGLEIFNQEKPDLILTDIKMPIMNGLELLERITKESKDTPVIVVSGVENMDDVAVALKYGAWDYVTKPLKEMIVLERAVAKALERSRLIEENRLYRLALEAANQALKKSLDVLEEDQRAGRNVQMRMLPEQNIRFGEYQFSHNISPSLYLSGDFVDYFRINDEKLGFYIADVSGHGSSSAFVTVLLKSLIALALTKYQLHNDTEILNPDKLLSNIGKEIYEAKLGKYLTIVYGVIDWIDHKLTFSIGGHFPNPIWLENGKAKYLEGKGFPVGIMQDASYKSTTLDFPKNVQLILFSDGVLEIIKENELPKKESHLLSLSEGSDGTVDYFLKNLELLGKKELPDDVTFLLLKRV